jgi:hypothetical protein
MRSSPAMLICHWWAPLHFKSSFWNVAEDELDTIGSYYDLQVGVSPWHWCFLPPRSYIFHSSEHSLPSSSHDFLVARKLPWCDCCTSVRSAPHPTLSWVSCTSPTKACS